MANGLYKAVRDCQFIHVKFLVESGLSLNQKNGQSEHVLFAALRIQDDDKRLKMFRYLMNHNADIKSMDKSTGRDVLMWAVFLNRKTEAELVMFELAGDINFQRKDKYGRSILHYATLRGNAELLQKIVHQMKQYAISVDIADAEGFTPYMLAKRLGYDECADILLNEGEASPHKFDKNRKTVFQWIDDGNKEQEELRNEEEDKKITTYKLLGRLPELKEAQFKASDVQIVESYKDKQLLRSAVKTPNHYDHVDVKEFGRMAAKKHKSKSLHNLMDDNSMSSRLRRMSASSNISAKSMDQAMRLLNLKHDPDEINKQLHYKKDISRSIPDMMTILEQQSCTSYRSTARDKISEPEVSSQGKIVTSTMAIIFGKNGKKKIVQKDMNKKHKLTTISEIQSGRNSMVKHNGL